MAKNTSPFPARRLILGALAVILCVAALVVAFMPSSGTQVSYPQFVSELQAGKVTQARIGDSQVSYWLEGDDQEYITDNPDYDGFKADLLLAGVEVEEESAQDTFLLVTDVLFYGVFFGVLIWGAYKALTFQRSTFKVVRRTGVSFADIAGMESLKRELTQVVDMMKNPQAYAARGIRPPRGVVLEGPPGNGKTLFAKALATECGVRFIATRGADFQSALMSLGARKIRSLFQTARKKRPCIVFIDEFDSIGERRNYAGTGVDKENNRIITTMLNEMDGFSTTDGVLVIAATNSYASLDGALVRPGRFDLKYTVGMPDAATRRELVRIYTKGRVLASNVTSELLVSWTAGLSCAAIEALLNEAQSLALLSESCVIDRDDVIRAAEKVQVHLKLQG